LFREGPEESETQLFELIGGLLSEAGARYERFREERLRSENEAEGYTKGQLNAFLADAYRFDTEFAKHEAAAQRLAEAGYPEARWQLAAIQVELQRSIAEVEEACRLTEAFDSRLMHPLTEPPEKRTAESGYAGKPSAPQIEEEIRLLSRIDGIYEEFCRAGQAFGALCTQYSYGLPSAILEGHWQQLEEMESRFAQVDVEAHRLSAGGHVAAKQRLSLVRGDLLGAIATVKKMHAARGDVDSRAAELETHVSQGLAESMQQMSRALARV
jgi:hypothetical protein